ncbi:DivIVA domain-containing protein [Actinoplanes regularis]|uniref:Cell wall synthesis protein Wag31 n=1 Tax=Actinoplanes regularis TaxID=52697 RepID=A0A239HZ65_9ACTN|nr:DivIVA domain-containing protein [Actinoplanes regularis]GIE91296.1 cell wall synthesis protein Wag31 [Actinoplanes regularis]SNS86640.1 DivIVA domain-containing protein [Actinoplanes regularis]
MPLTPADVNGITFQKAALGSRGYDAEEVDALREEITQEIARLLAENAALQDQARRVDAAAEDDQAALSAVSAELDRARAARDRAERDAHSLHGRLEAARRETAGRETARRETAGRETAEPLADDGGRVLAVARRTAEEHLASVSQESEDMLLDAREQSEQLIERARSTANGIEEASRRRDTEAAAELRDEHAALEHEVAELTEFAENYRVALEDDVRHQAEL